MQGEADTVVRTNAVGVVIRPDFSLRSPELTWERRVSLISACCFWICRSSSRDFSTVIAFYLVFQLERSSWYMR